MSEHSLSIEDLRKQPYLPVFEQSNADLFFGRETEISELKERMEKHRITTVFGKPGVGITSLLKAGIIPDLEELEYFCVHIECSGNPLMQIEGELRKSTDMGEIADEEGESSLILLLKYAPKKQIVLFLDQFEQFFEQPQDIQDSFLANIAECVEVSNLGVRFVIAVREYSLPKLYALSNELPGIIDNIFELKGLSREGSRSAIYGLAKYFCVTIEEKLIELVLGSFEDDTYDAPVIWIIFTQLVKDPDRSKNTITYKDYITLDGLAGILEKYYEDILNLLKDNDKKIARAIIREIASAHLKGNLPNFANLAERLLVGEDKVNKVKDRLIAYRLIRSRGQIDYEIFPEYLDKVISEREEREQAINDRVRTLLQRQLLDWRERRSIPELRDFEEIDSRREFLGLNEEEIEMMFRCAVAHDKEVDYWSKRVKTGDAKVNIALELSEHNETKPKVQKNALHALCEFGMAKEIDSLVREKAIYLLVRIVKFDKDKDKVIRNLAATALMRFGNEETFKDLKSLLIPAISIDSKFQSNLDSNNISRELRQELKSNRISLSEENVTVSIEEKDRKWVITDENQIYTVWKEKGELNIYADEKSIRDNIAYAFGSLAFKDVHEHAKDLYKKAVDYIVQQTDDYVREFLGGDNSLAREIEQENCILYLGSDLPVKTGDGEKFVSIEHLIEELASQCEPGNGEKTLPHVVQCFLEQHNGSREKESREELKKVIDEIMAPSELHKSIAKLPFNTIITTNYDHLSKRAFEDSNCQRKVESFNSMEWPPLRVENQVRICHILGQLEKPHTLVITYADYQSFSEKNPSTLAEMKLGLREKNIIFVGFDVCSDFFGRLYDKTVFTAPWYKRFCLAIQSNCDENQKKQWDDRGLKIIEVNPKGFMDALQRSEPSEEKDEKKDEYEGNPYKGVYPFEMTDAPFFFGRENESHRLADGIMSEKIVVLIGKSGVGKSSLINAGVQPILERLDCWFPDEIRCTPSKIEGTAELTSEIQAKIIEKLNDEKISTEELTNHPEEGLHVFLKQVEECLSESALVIILDQFEEFFNLQDEYREHFIGELKECIDDKELMTRFLISMRQEFWEGLLEFERQIPTIFDNIATLEKLSPTRAEQAVKNPLRKMGIEPDMEFVGTLLEDLRGTEESEAPVGLIHPTILSAVCYQIYEEYKPEEESLFDAYNRLERAEKIWSKYIDNILRRKFSVSVKITEQSLENLESEDVPDDVFEKLQSLKNQVFIGEEKFLDILKKTIGDEQTVRFKSLILKHANFSQKDKPSKDEKIVLEILKKMTTLKKTKKLMRVEDIIWNLYTDGKLISRERAEEFISKLEYINLVREVRARGEEMYEIVHDSLAKKIREDEKLFDDDYIALRECEEILQPRVERWYKSEERRDTEEQQDGEKLLSQDLFQEINKRDERIKKKLYDFEIKLFMLANSIFYGEDIEYWAGRLRDDKQLAKHSEKVIKLFKKLLNDDWIHYQNEKNNIQMPPAEVKLRAIKALEKLCKT